MEREVWHIFYLKVTSLIAITTFLIVTSYLAVTFGNYYAIYETQYSVKLESHEIHRQNWSQFIYICYLGTLLTCDLITCLAILYNLNYILLFNVFHHMTLLLVKVYSGFELHIPGEHSEGVLLLFVVLHITIIVSLSLLYKKLDSVIELKQIFTKELKKEKEHETERLKNRDNLNKRLLDEYQQKYVDHSGRSSGRDSNRHVELEPVDIEHDFDTVKEKLSNQHRNNRNDQPNGYTNYNEYKNQNYDSDGYLKAMNYRNIYSDAKRCQLTKNQLTNSEDLILDRLNKQNSVLKHTRSYSVDDESDDIYLEPDDAYIDNDYDYLKCNIDDDEHPYAQIQPKNMASFSSRTIQPANDKPPDLPSPNSKGKKIDPIISTKSVDKSVQTSQANSSNETMYSTRDTLDSNFQTNAFAIKESDQKYTNNTKSRKVEYSTLKYAHKVYYESAV